VSKFHKSRFHAILRDVAASPPEGSKAQEQNISGVFTFLVVVSSTSL